MLARKKYNLNVYTLLISVLLMLAFLNAFNKFYYFIFIAFLLLLPNSHFKISLSKGFVALLAFSASLLLFNDNSSSTFNSILKCFTYPICFIIGNSIYELFAQKNTEKHGIWILIVQVACLGLFIHLLLNYNKNGDILNREITDYWTDSVSSATCQAAIGTIPLAFGLGLLFSDAGIFKKIVAIVIITFVMLYNLILAGRTLIVMALIVLGCLIIYSFIKSKNKKKLRLLCITILVIFLLLLLFNENIFGVKDVIENSSFYSRFYGKESYQQIDADTRLIIKGKYLEKMLSYPFGNESLHKVVGGYAHDLLLDTYSYASIFAFIALAYFLVLSSINFFKIMKNSKFNTSFKCLFLAVHIVVYIEFFMEPIIEGVPWLFCAFCVLQGVEHKIIKQI